MVSPPRGGFSSLYRRAKFFPDLGKGGPMWLILVGRRHVRKLRSAKKLHLLQKLRLL
jgi:hypothetical protein